MSHARGAGEEADRPPPRGIKYLRSSGDGTFGFRAFGNDQEAVVQEMQSSNH
ncbi:hypothetical protein ACIQ6R_00360 [Streptomyces sp. NPDC096048]|uniref:hypothetical protein n=1 Tax=Streptomyces sp. NPDC096048 TaxID=3366072 RepID=UPI003816CD52